MDNFKMRISDLAKATSRKVAALPPIVQKRMTAKRRFWLMWSTVNWEQMTRRRNVQWSR